MSKHNDRFDAILASTPLNSSAARVTARGEHWVPEAQLPPGLLHWEAPPRTKPFVAPPQDPNHPDLKGKRFGRFTVVGVLDDDGGGKNRGARWVCRCDCGDYEAKTTKAIRTVLAGLAPAEGVGYRCFYCAQWQIVQGRYKKHGSKPLSAFTNAKPKIVIQRKPEAVIAQRIGSAVEDSVALAIAIIAELHKAGFRIVRERIPGNGDEAALKTTYGNADG